jgi:hypothetical protein
MQTLLLVSEQNATTAGARQFDEGRPVWLTWQNDALVLMDPG